MKKIFFIILIFSIFNSCQVWGLSSDYKKLSFNYKSRIVALDSFENLKPNLIYKINGKQLSEELKKYPKALVYVFTNVKNPKIKLERYVHYANENNYKLFLVMDGYMNLNDTLTQHNNFYSTPLFSIDNQHYESNNKLYYVRLFEIDLLQLEERYYKCFSCAYAFENGKFIKLINEI